MSHYFIEDKTLNYEVKLIEFKFHDKDFSLYSSNGIFSKNKLDYGSYFLLNEIIKLPLDGKILDYGCGNGVIGIITNLFNKNVKITYCDINPECLKLTRRNLEKYNLEGNIISDQEINNLNEKIFDYIFLNPPIRTGKKNIYSMYINSYRLLKENQEFYIVIRKDKGMSSHKAYLETLFKEVSILSKDKGYYILKMVK